MDIIAAWLIDFFFSAKIVVCTVCQFYAYFIVLSPCLSVTHYLFTFLFLSKQTRHGEKIISYLYFLCISGHAKCLSCEYM